jgi:hypothetical protein
MMLIEGMPKLAQSAQAHSAHVAIRISGICKGCSDAFETSVVATGERRSWL